MREWWASLALRKRRRVIAPEQGSGGLALADTTQPPPDDALPPPDDSAFFAWLLDSLPRPEAALHPAESQALAALEALRHHTRNAAELLPRAPAVIPQLMHMLRQDDQSLAVISQRVASDVMLSAEVLRQARSAAYRSAGHGSAGDAASPPADLRQALALLGVDGLRAVIARVVLRPLFDGQSGRLAGQAAARAWRHAETEARLAAEAAQAQGIDSFDAYLGGLVHGSGWTVAWRTLDRLDPPLALPASAAFVQRLLPLTEALFGQVVADWRLTPALTTLCRAVRDGAPLAAQPLGAVLQQARREALARMLRDEVQRVRAEPQAPAR